MTWRPVGRFRVGAMRDRITIQTLTVSISDAGDKSESWANTYTDEPAQFDSVSGGETLRGRQVDAGITAVFIVRYRDSLTSTQRVVYGGTNYGIVYTRPVEGGRRYIELYCKSS